MGRIVRKIVRPGDKPTPAQIEEVKNAARYPIVFDEDDPEYTLEELEQMRLAAIKKRAGQKKEVVAIRLSHNTLEKAKATGKGYTGFLARLIENAINDKDMVARSL